MTESQNLRPYDLAIAPGLHTVMPAHTVQVNCCVWTPKLKINVLTLYGPIVKELSIANKDSSESWTAGLFTSNHVI